MTSMVRRRNTRSKRKRCSRPRSMKEEIARGLEIGLPGADSIQDRRIPTFSRGELPHFAGINTFVKAPYIEDVRKCGQYDVAILGAPFDGGTTYRSGTRLALRAFARFRLCMDPIALSSAWICGSRFPCAYLGDVFTIPANIERRSIRSIRVFRTSYESAFPVVLGDDHSLGS